jgi:hypothetical protein
MRLASGLGTVVPVACLCSMDYEPIAPAAAKINQTAITTQETPAQTKVRLV